MSPEAFYQLKLDQLTLEVKEAKKTVQRWRFLRLLSFVATAVFSSIFFNESWLLIGIVSIGIISFLVFVSKSVDAQLNFDVVTHKKDLVEKELIQLTEWKGQFDLLGKHEISSTLFANDLDFFQKNGLFSWINRTTSIVGEEKLIQRFLSNEHISEEKIIQFQEQVKQLSQHMEWTHDFRSGSFIAENNVHYQVRLSHLSKHIFQNSKLVRVCRYLIPIVSISALILVKLNVIQLAHFSILTTIIFVLIGMHIKETNSWYSKISLYEPRIKSVLHQLQSLAKIPISIEDYSELNAFNTALKKWTAISKRFDLRLNIVVSIPLNLFFAWDFQQRCALEDWMKTYGNTLQDWESKLADIDVLISAATLRFNHESQSTFAQFSKAFHIQLTDCTHPQIHPSKSVANDFELKETQQFVLLTGPNMAGKSTYLRAVGINLVLAKNGFPVFCKTCIIPPLGLFTSMRTSDNLNDESSYFHAELSRLKMIQNACINEAFPFVLLDEILKGTNSVDKELGSKNFLLKMSRLGIKGVLATHDLALCELSKTHAQFVNFHFDSTIEHNELTFDYKIRPGICQNMNASFLLKKMELVD